MRSFQAAAHAKSGGLCKTGSSPRDVSATKDKLVQWKSTRVYNVVIRSVETGNGLIRKTDKARQRSREGA